MRIFKFIIILVSIAQCVLLAYGKETEQNRNSNGRIFSGIGTALTPRNFPNHTSADVNQMFQTGSEIGQYAVFIYQWSDSNMFSTAKEMLKMSNEHDLKPIIGLSPTILGGLRDQLDVPKKVRKKAKDNLSFANPDVHKPFIDTVIELARLKPPYLCLATEINLMAFKNIKEYIYFAHVYKKLYYVIKKISPETKVFVSFQLDYMNILDDKEPDKINEHTKLIDIFRPELDLIAFTSYPAYHYPNPSYIPGNYYSRMYNHIKKSDEIMFMEIGWPGDGREDSDKQRDFILVLPGLMKEVRPKILAWSLLHDVNTSQLAADLATTGLIKQNGEVKPAFKVFKALNEK